MLEIRNIQKSFGSLEVLKGIDLTVEKGEIDLSGTIDSVSYSDIKQAGAQGENFFAKLFR